mgnify:CR=1 FL=1
MFWLIQLFYWAFGRKLVRFTYSELVGKNQPYIPERLAQLGYTVSVTVTVSDNPDLEPYLKISFLEKIGPIRTIIYGASPAFCEWYLLQHVEARHVIPAVIVIDSSRMTVRLLEETL